MYMKLPSASHDGDLLPPSSEAVCLWMPVAEEQLQERGLHLLLVSSLEWPICGLLQESECWTMRCVFGLIQRGSTCVLMYWVSPLIYFSPYCVHWLAVILWDGRQESSCTLPGEAMNSSCCAKGLWCHWAMVPFLSTDPSFLTSSLHFLRRSPAKGLAQVKGCTLPTLGERHTLHPHAMMSAHFGVAGERVGMGLKSVTFSDNLLKYFWVTVNKFSLGKLLDGMTADMSFNLQQRWWRSLLPTLEKHHGTDTVVFDRYEISSTKDREPWTVQEAIICDSNVQWKFASSCQQSNFGFQRHKETTLHRHTWKQFAGQRPQCSSYCSWERCSHSENCFQLGTWLILSSASRSC